LLSEHNVFLAYHLDLSINTIHHVSHLLQVLLKPAKPWQCAFRTVGWTVLQRGMLGLSKLDGLRNLVAFAVQLDDARTTTTFKGIFLVLLLHSTQSGASGRVIRCISGWSCLFPTEIKFARRLKNSGFFENHIELIWNIVRVSLVITAQHAIMKIFFISVGFSLVLLHKHVRHLTGTQVWVVMQEVRVNQRLSNVQLRVEKRHRWV
jgi:hypothetical protein